MSDIHEILKKYWGYDSFRPLQEDIIASVLSGHDTIGLLPTGGGKSITFQVPAIALGGLCLVVTPLISLMKDQVDHLVKLGIKASAVFMGMSHQEILETYERVIIQRYNFLYLSPERLETQLFQAKLQYMDVRLLVVDEAHCISQWGYDFRPPYLRIAEIRKLITQDVPSLALTATATPAVVDDIRQKLAFRKGFQIFKASFVRPNLSYNVLHTEDKLGKMIQLLGNMESGAAIIYTRSRKKTRDIAETLTREGITANFYHAGLSAEEKQKRQDEWINGTVPVIVATNAFGMGIDKPDVRVVIHLDIPPSPEEYFQEAGRAGRDQKPSVAWMFVANKDKTNLIKHLSDEYPEREYIRIVYQKLANYFQIAIGAAQNAMFEFEIMKFCAAYKLSLSPTYYALKILEHAGYIVYAEEPDRHSRLMITTSKEKLYHLDKFDRNSQKVLQTLLRLYTGLFSDYVFIREEDIMARTGMSREELYQNLLLLSRFHILHYVPARQKPAIIYLTPRLENEEIRISHIIYEDRKERQAARINAIIDYVNNEDECRLKLLLRYFGETLHEDCKVCDICRSADSKIAGNIEEQKDFIRQQVINLIKNKGPMLPVEITSQFNNVPAELTAHVVREMIMNEELCLDNKKISLNR